MTSKQEGPTANGTTYSDDTNEDSQPSPRTSFSNVMPGVSQHKLNSMAQQSSLPMRESVSSASDLPYASAQANLSPNSIDWEQLYYDQHRVIQHLRSRVQSLEADLNRSRNDSGLGGYAWPDQIRNHFGGQVHDDSLLKSQTGSIDTGRSNKQSAVGGLHDNKARTDFHTSENIRQTEMDTARTSAYPHKRASQPASAMSLTSIPENNLSDVHNEIGFSQHIDSGLLVDNDDDPRSPPTTKIPSPKHLRTHAGHTPPEPGMINEAQLHTLRTAANKDGADEDSALSEPRIISEPSEIDELTRRLQEVASSDDLQIPQALRRLNGVEDDAGTSPAVSGQQSPIDTEGIVLRRKDSTNFGLPYGMPPRRASGRT